MSVCVCRNNQIWFVKKGELIIKCILLLTQNLVPRTHKARQHKNFKATKVLIDLVNVLVPKERKKSILLFLSQKKDLGKKT